MVIATCCTEYVFCGETASLYSEVHREVQAAAKFDSALNLCTTQYPPPLPSCGELQGQGYELDDCKPMDLYSLRRCDASSAL